MDRRKFIGSSLVAGLATTGLTSCVSNSSIKTDQKSDILSLSERQKWLAPFACNIEQWFRPMPFLDRINAAKALGFSAVEIWNPNQAKKGKTPESIAKRAKEQGITITTYSPSAPNFADPKNEQAFMQWLDGAIAAGKTLNIPNFNLTGHKLIEGLSEAQMLENYTRVLKKVAPRLEAVNMVATIEPYNPFNHPGHFIYGNEPALSICREVNSPSVKINWDFFHMQRTNGNLITNLENGFDQVAYIQFADSPSRNQPGTGEVAYGKVFTRLRELGYTGYIGAEFFPENKDSLRAASDLARLAKSINLQPSF
ncbi:TIM barrel protein [Paraglaciecola aquimarina]|uniref:TIM barrel protein n=1 Tax=Paraglaciecola algarum TaxID=3050085 RepID=A0ABS9D7D4_9ALTE|nr:TIM barrel protein [Paraglaciecola sp. G1-23]MCF2948873.1 TIM barrel protein [Paraglaciecola sp. G1-23]